MYNRYFLTMPALFLMLTVFAQNKTTELPPSDFIKQFKATSGSVLLDVRSAEEMEEGYIEGAGNLDFNSGQFGEELPELDKNKTYFLYCLSGIRSGRAADLMKEKGFKNVYTLEGGMKAWRAKKMPVKEKP